MNPAILAYVALPGQFSPVFAERLRAGVPYGRRMRLPADSAMAGASLLGIALARRLLGEVHGLPAESVTLRFPYRAKPYCAQGADFSISHSAGWLAALVSAGTRVGLDIEAQPALPGAFPSRDLGDWTAREAMLKACGAGLDRLSEVQVGDDYCLWQQQHWLLIRPSAPPGVHSAIVSEQPLRLSTREFTWRSLVASLGEEAVCA